MASKTSLSGLDLGSMIAPINYNMIRWMNSLSKLGTEVKAMLESNEGIVPKTSDCTMRAKKKSSVRYFIKPTEDMQGSSKFLHRLGKATTSVICYLKV